MKTEILIAPCAFALAGYPDTTNNDDASLIVGTSTDAVSGGGTALIQLCGEMDEPSWNWSEGSIYYGQNGVLTQTVPSSGWLMIIGLAVSQTRILIDPHPRIVLGA